MKLHVYKIKFLFTKLKKLLIYTGKPEFQKYKSEKKTKKKTVSRFLLLLHAPSAGDVLYEYTARGAFNNRATSYHVKPGGVLFTILYIECTTGRFTIKTSIPASSQPVSFVVHKSAIRLHPSPLERVTADDNESRTLPRTECSRAASDVRRRLFPLCLSVSLSLLRHSILLHSILHLSILHHSISRPSHA